MVRDLPSKHDVDARILYRFGKQADKRKSPNPTTRKNQLFFFFKKKKDLDKRTGAGDRCKCSPDRKSRSFCRITTGIRRDPTES